MSGIAVARPPQHSYSHYSHYLYYFFHFLLFSLIFPIFLTPLILSPYLKPLHSFRSPPPFSYPLSLSHIFNLFSAAVNTSSPLIRQLFQTIQIFTNHISNHLLYLQSRQLPLNRVINISKFCPFSSTISFFHTNFHKSLYLNKLHNQKILQLIYQ